MSVTQMPTLNHLILWLDSSQMTQLTITQSMGVQRWCDVRQTVLPENCVFQTVAAKQPVYRHSPVYKKSYIDFNFGVAGGNQHLRTGEYGGKVFNAKARITIYAILKSTDLQAWNGRYVYQAIGLRGSDFELKVTAAGGVTIPDIECAGCGVSLFFRPDSPFAIDGWQLVKMKHTTKAEIATWLTIASDGYGMSFSIKELLMYDETIVTDYDDYVIQEYLKLKWNVQKFVAWAPVPPVVLDVRLWLDVSVASSLQSRVETVPPPAAGGTSTQVTKITAWCDIRTGSPNLCLRQSQPLMQPQFTTLQVEFLENSAATLIAETLAVASVTTVYMIVKPVKFVFYKQYFYHSPAFWFRGDANSNLWPKTSPDISMVASSDQAVDGWFLLKIVHPAFTESTTRFSLGKGIDNMAFNIRELIMYGGSAVSSDNDKIIREYLGVKWNVKANPDPTGNINAPTPPTNAPSKAPTNAPTHAPTHAPSNAPTHAPSSAPSNAPSRPPTEYADKPFRESTLFIIGASVAAGASGIGVGALLYFQSNTVKLPWAKYQAQAKKSSNLNIITEL